MTDQYTVKYLNIWTPKKIAIRPSLKNDLFAVIQLKVLSVDR